MKLKRYQKPVIELLQLDSYEMILSSNLDGKLGKFTEGTAGNNSANSSSSSSSIANDPTGMRGYDDDSMDFPDDEGDNNNYSQ